MDNKRLGIPLFHGTSSLFLESILGSGLGGRNPLLELNLFSFVDELRPLIETHLADTQLYRARAGTFGLMAAQASAELNFQHGDTYVTPSESTAVRYAVNKRYGSELLTYSLDFLKCLVERDVEGVRTIMFQRYPAIFELLDISPAPILFEVISADTSALCAEGGGAPTESLNRIAECVAQSPSNYEAMLQQTNFRLRSPVDRLGLRVWFINVTRWHPTAPEYLLYELRQGPSA